ncbi:hypothetical protein V6N12_012956 [Hibiscus sabdariffa]|uniref:Peptidylprolyl isomerase n=1 Tax=Hibiscus sabdariffa TaxID=183260 RepID=A0ABR2EFW9_9ROSI
MHMSTDEYYLNLHVVGNLCMTHILGYGQRVVEGFDKGIEEANHEIIEEDNEGDGDGNDGDDVYFVKVGYLSDDEEEEELQAGRKKLRRVKEKSIINFDESKSDMERTEKDVQEDAELEEEREEGTIFECGLEKKNMILTAMVI